MTGKTHALAGGVAALGVTLLVQEQAWLALDLNPLLTSGRLQYLAIGLIGSVAALIPDLDNSESRLENWRIFGVKPLKPLADLVNLLFSHRGFLHSLLAIMLLSLILLSLPSAIELHWRVAILSGYLSHLITDGLTPDGIELLYPWGQQIRFLPRWLAIRTGSFFESLFYLLLLGGLIWLVDLAIIV